jgi:hypothetical protein
MNSEVTNRFSAAASPSSARQKAVTCFTPRSALGRAASPWARTSVSTRPGALVAGAAPPPGTGTMGTWAGGGARMVASAAAVWLDGDAGDGVPDEAQAARTSTAVGVSAGRMRARA